MIDVEYSPNDVESVTSKLSIFEDCGWRGYEEKLPSLDFSYKDFYIYCFDPGLEDIITSRNYNSKLRYLSWVDSSVLTHHYALHKDIAAFVLDNPSSNRLVNAYIESHLFNPLQDYDKFVRSVNVNIRVVAAQYCAYETLASLKKDVSKKVRRVVYSRLGPVGHIDDMLTDKSADIRQLGVSLAPIGYPGLSKMTNEIARGVFAGLVEKIRREDLPMLLSNRNLKDNWVSKKFETRMNSNH